jgi:alpha-tubulin suppressor-like RCC1 family protein
MSSRPLLFASLLVLTTLAASACNLIFSIEPGEPLGTGGGAPDGGGAGGQGGTGGTGATGGAGGTGATGGGGSGGGATCTANTATCVGAVLHPCDASGHPSPTVACDSIAGCDASARACIARESLPRLGVGTGRVCAIEDDRSVRCWGLNDGALVPDDPHATLPTAVPLGGVAGVRQLSIATSHGCLIQDDGAVICWGSNDSGETGVPDGSPRTPAKIAMPGSLPALQVSTAHRCSCARLADGTVACWGQEETGCFGIASPMYKVTYTPTLVPGITSAVELYAGAYDTPSCVRRADGKVLCWGMNGPPKEIPGVDDATDIALGRVTVFIQSASKGLLWSSPMGDGFSAAAPYGVAFGVKAIEGGEQVCVLREDGAVLCKVLGNPPPQLPQAVTQLPAGTIAEIAVGFGLSYDATLQCLRLEGATLADKVYCWGDDLAGALGAGAPENFRAPQAVPVISGATALSTAQQSTSVVLGSGAVAYWGLSSTLEGIGTKTPKVVGTLGNDNAQVSTNDIARRAYVIKKTGALTLLDTGLFLQNQRLQKSGFSDFSRARDWGHYDIALRANGTLVVYGDDAISNASGIYGDGTTLAVADATKVVPGLSGVQALASYGDDYGEHPAHACAIVANGALVCWGNNWNGEVGSGPPVDVVSTPLPVTIPNNEAIVSVAVGRFFTCAASAAGSVYCWGSNSHGQLGTDPIFPSLPIPNLVAGINDAIAVSAREAHVCALLADKTVTCWGANGEGQLADGSFEHRFAPTPVAGLSDVAEISAGPYHTCVRHTGGTISCWGSSYDGQVGTGVIGVYPSPLKVLGL